MIKFISKIFMAIVACLFCVQTALAADTWSYPSKKPDGKFGGGSGTASSPYLINNAQQLADLAWMVNDGTYYKGKYFKLTTDITLNDITWGDNHQPTNKESLKVWTPIGRKGIFTPYRFEGIFDGDEHTISGLVLGISDYTSTAYLGLFAFLDNAIIRNLNIKDSYMYGPRGDATAGFLAAKMEDTQVEGCHVTSSNIRFWSGEGERIGGMVGRGSGNISFTSCSFSGYNYLDADGYYVWIAGLLAEGEPTITNCRVDGTIYISSNKTDYYGRDWRAYGLSQSAKDIVGCVSNIDFVIEERNQDCYGYYPSYYTLCLYTLCGSTKTVSRSADIGTITINKAIGWSGSISPIEKASTVSDCAFYTKINCTNADGDDKRFYYYPLGCNISKGNNNVILTGDEFLPEDAKKKIKLEKIQITSDDQTNFTGSISELQASSIFYKLNYNSDATTKWGKFSDNSIYNGCPLPVACGGQLNSELRGEGTEQSPYLLGSEAELRILADGVSNGTIETSDKYFALTSDIDMSSSSKRLKAIGSIDYPFLGTFDGKGHVISNAKLDNGLFGTLGGTVKNLTIVEAKLSNNSSCNGPLVSTLGTTSNKATLTNCSVGGDITVDASSTPFLTYIGGLCGRTINGTISDCYFKGHLIITNGSKAKGNIGGLIGEMGNATVQDCYASFGVSDQGNLKVNGIVGDRTIKGTFTNCYYVCNDATSADGSSSSDCGTACSNDDELFSNYVYTTESSWIKGAFRPVLKNTRNYAATAADGTGQEAYFDAIPLKNSNSSGNDIYHYTLKTGDENDKLLWALPNLAIYNQAEKADYILNCTLDPSKSLNYNKRSDTDVETVRINMHYPLKVTGDNNNYYMLCLPGTVNRGDFPEGSKLFIGGKAYGEGTARYMHVIEADSVAGGIPFIAYIPSSENGKTLDIVMRSKMAIEPLKQITYGDGKTQELDLTGTYKSTNVEGALNLIAIVDGKTWLKGSSNTQAPFTSYLVGDAVELQDYLLLDEMSNETDKLLEEYDQEGARVMLKRTLRNDGWNTVCLPFDMTADEVEATFGTGTKVEELGNVGMTDGVCTLSFTSVTDGMKAGVPYLVKPANTGSSYTLASRNISNTPSSVERDVVIDGTNATITLYGTFGRKMLGVDDTDEYFTQDNTIYHVADGQQIVMNGFRAYITASEKAAAAMANARMIHGDGSTTALRLIEIGSTADGKQRVYDLQGIEKRVNSAQQHGVYIKGGKKYVK